MRIYYLLTTIDPVIISQSNATINNHECLDYIPGSAILGVIAAKIYQQQQNDTSNKTWDIFHNGCVKFGPCYPVSNGQLTLPTPASWHFKKGDSAIDNNGAYNSDAITNHACAKFSRQEGIQYKQCRDGYITTTGDAANVDIGLTTRTAINRNTGIAKESSLFSYAYIEAKQEFIGWIESDNKEYITEIINLLKSNIKIGRSRNTEFGRVSIRQLDTDCVPKQKNNQNSNYNKKQLVIWCLSDCEFLDKNGIPTYTPELSTLIGGAQGTLNPEKSFIRTTKVSRFNQKRQGPDTEQLLVSKGSVLVYNILNSSTNISQEQLNKLENNGVGINSQQGLGWIMLNPDWADEIKPSSKNLFKNITFKLSKNLIPEQNSKLITWIKAKQKAENINKNSKDEAKELLSNIYTAYNNARQYNNIDPSNNAGPSTTQWNLVLNELRNNNKDFKQVLFSGEHAICKAKNDPYGWGISWEQNQKLFSFSSYIQELFKDYLDNNTPTLLILLDQINRYDLSTVEGLKTAKQQLDLKLNNTAKKSYQEAQ